MIRIIAWVAPIYLVDVIWSAVSLHAWLYLSFSIATVYGLRGLGRLMFSGPCSGP